MQPTPVSAPSEAATSTILPTAPPSEPLDHTSSDVSQPGPGTSDTASFSNTEEQYLLVLSGLIGSGKSTFARALCHHFPNWRRCNQDELGDRHAVVYAARTALLAGHHVVIDRTNIDAKQRRTWLELAQELSTPADEASGSKTRKIVTISLTLMISTVAAEERLRVRVGHETIKTPEDALGILPHFLRSYQKASTEEGFQYVLTYPAGKISREPSEQEVREILLERLEREERAQGVLPDRPPARGSGGGRGRGGERGRGGWRGRGGRGGSAVYAPHHQHQPYPPPAFRGDTPQTGAALIQDQTAAPPSFAAAAASLPPASLQYDTQPQPQISS